MKTLYEIIAAKRDGKRLSSDEITYLVNGFATGKITDYQFSALLMAAFINGLDSGETEALTTAMLQSGETITINGLNRPLIDKHSTGGVGDKLSLILSPLLANLGIAVGMFSGRGLGHTGGTLDKLEAIPGMKVFLSQARFAALIRKHHFAIIGQTEKIAPADRKIYALRNATGTVESIPLIVASIMSKKLALKSDGIVFDVKAGTGAFMKSTHCAGKLARSLLAVANAANLPARAVITDMSQPTGLTIGNYLEVIETIDVLQGSGPADTKTLVIEIAAQMLLVAGVELKLTIARKKVTQELATGRSFESFCRYISDCGGKIKNLEKPENALCKTHKVIVRAQESGYFHFSDSARLGYIAGNLGAGRARVSDVIDPLAGIRLLEAPGSKVCAAQPLAILFSGKRNRLAEAKRDLLAGIVYARSKSQRRLIRVRLQNDRKAGKTIHRRSL